MLVIGARFRTLAAARAALRAVRGSLSVAAGDVAVGALGSTRYDAPDEHFLLAGRFDPEDAAAVTAIVHAEGGRVIERRSDTPRPAVMEPAPPAAPARSARPLGRLTARRASRPTAPIAGALRGHGRTSTWLRRPSPPLRVRTARGHRFEA